MTDSRHQREPPFRSMVFSLAWPRAASRVLRDEFNIIHRRGDKLRCVFLLDLGAPGVA